MKRAITGSVLAILLVAVAPARASNVFGADDIVVALLDTGVLPSHGEFEWGGPSDDTDQIVAWWDFTNDEVGPYLPTPGQRWDPRNPLPYDDHGHGTATASLAVGRNAVAPDRKARAYAPGADLAVAKVCVSDGSCPGDLPAAIRWAVETAEADVVNISIGSRLPNGDWLSKVHEAAAIARAQGALIVVSNGNGTGGAGLVPGPGWFTSSGDSTNVLSVGSSDAIFQAGFTWDPEVSAPATLVPVASHRCPACYTEMSGTSFASPLVAGMAAAAMGIARANGHADDPDAIETLLKYTAFDSAMPPWIEGYGWHGDYTFDGLLVPHAAAGTLPARPDPDPNALYVDTIAATLRDVVSNKLDRDAIAMVPTGLGATGPAGSIDLGTPSGLQEVELHTITLAPGEQVLLRVDTGGLNVRLRVFSGADPVLRATDEVAASPFGAPEPALSFRSAAGGTYRVAVLSEFAMPLSTAPYVLDVLASAGAEAAFASQDLYVTNYSQIN